MSKSRIMRDHEYYWVETLQCWCNRSGNPVMIFPFVGDRSTEQWIVYVPLSRVEHELTGEDIEQRAFAIAAGFITQAVSRDTGRWRPCGESGALFVLELK